MNGLLSSQPRSEKRPGDTAQGNESARPFGPEIPLNQENVIVTFKPGALSSSSMVAS